MPNLIEGIQQEQARVREMIKQYTDPSLNGAGNLSAAFMTASLKRADRAIASGDVVEMCRVLKDLQEYES